MHELYITKSDIDFFSLPGPATPSVEIEATVRSTTLIESKNLGI